MPRHSALPSADDLHKICIPRQIPNTGCRNDLITRSRFKVRINRIAEVASPTPGMITRSAVEISSAESVTKGSPPSLAMAS
ncbi:hypothetical protein WAI79_21190, partial [Acinetobacter baumannii]